MELREAEMSAAYQIEGTSQSAALKYDLALYEKPGREGHSRKPLKEAAP